MKFDFFKKLFLLILLFFALAPNTSVKAEITSSNEVSGSILYTFSSACSSLQNLKKTRGVIVPKGATSVNTIYIYFPGTNNPSVQSMCSTDKLCSAAAQLKSAIFISESDNKGTQTQVLSKDEISCFINEAKNVLKSAGVSYSENYIVAGHSGGVNFVRYFLQNGFSVQKTLIFDGCSIDGHWCKTIANTGNAGNILIYNSSDTQSKSTIPGSEEISSLPNVKILNLQSDHMSIPKKCFLDHVTGDKCNSVPQKLKFGAECYNDNDSACESNDCESSDLIDEKTKQKRWFCDCNDDDDCTKNWGEAPGKGGWSCVEAQGNYHDLDYCQDKIKDTILPSLDSANSGPFAIIRNTEGALSALSDEIKNMMTSPRPRIEIPGLNFTDPNIVKNNTVSESDGIYMYIPYLGEYISALYKYAVVIASIFAVMIIINHGFNLLMGGNSSEKIQASKKRIIEAVIGLLIAITSYTILYTVNPDLVNFKSLRVKYVEGQSIDVDDPGLSPEDAAKNGVPQNGSESETPGATTDFANLKPQAAYKCTPKDIREVALALGTANICTHPKTCALTASYILTRAGCKRKDQPGKEFLGSSFDTALGKTAMDQMNWKEYPKQISLGAGKTPIIVGPELTNLPVGLLWRESGHSAISIGCGQLVESSYARKPFEDFWPKDIFNEIDKSIGINYQNDDAIRKISKVLLTKKLCPLVASDSKGSTICDYCAKLPWKPSHGPVIGPDDKPGTLGGNHNAFVFVAEKERLAKFTKLYYDPAFYPNPTTSDNCPVN